MERTNYERIIEQEQQELDQVIDEMFEILLKLRQEEAEDLKRWDEKKRSGNPDEDITRPNSREKEKTEVRDALNSLYESRLNLVIENEDTGIQEQKEVRIGLHGYRHGSKRYIYSWAEPLCQAFSSNDPPEEVRYVDTDKYGRPRTSVSTLYLKRILSLEKGRVIDVNQVFPKEENDRKIWDNFLKELARRRNSKEFQNIVFTIQEQQNEIIQAPESKNIIVQGCAGSGKSMIMLHRLPVLINRQFNGLDLEKMYIITPSEIYKERAGALFHELELDRLGKSPIGMGTIEKYYDRCIKKYVDQYAGTYKKLKDGYGSVNYNAKITAESAAYIYSEECSNDIDTYLKKKTVAEWKDISTAQSVLGLKPAELQGGTYHEALSFRVRQYEDVFMENRGRLTDCLNNVKRLCEDLNQFQTTLASRKDAITGAIKRKILFDSNNIKELEEKLKKLNPAVDSAVYDTYRNRIRTFENDIEKLNIETRLCEDESGYFSEINKIYDLITEAVVPFEGYIENKKELNTDSLYQYMGEVHLFLKRLAQVESAVDSISEPFSNYVPPVKKSAEKVLQKAHSLAEQEYHIIPEGEFLEIEEAYKAAAETRDTIILDTYYVVLNQLQYEYKPRGLKWAIKDSPYIYLRILFSYFGVTGAAPDQLISIDEVQSMALSEINLIRNVNKNSVVLNLFGDGFQHFEGTKGTDNLEEFVSKIWQGEEEKSYYVMDINYRNAYEIVEYCNKRFSSKMKSVPGMGTLGGKVHVIHDMAELGAVLDKLGGVPREEGLYAVIVKDADEAEYVINSVNNSSGVFCDLSGENQEIDPGKWNVLKIEDAKGLEFHTVVAIAGKMTEHEKYVAYTRALNNLYLTEEPIGPDPEKRESEKPHKNFYIV